MMRAVARHLAALAQALGLAAFVAGAALAQTITLPVPTVTVYPGDVIEADVIGERTFRASQIGNRVAESPKMLIGKVARRTLLPNHPVSLNAIDELDLVTRGMPVQLVFRQSGLEIITYAAPLQDGSEGDVIRVRNVDSGAVVVGVVQADGSVRVGR